MKMKKLLSLGLALILCLSLCACESEEDRALRSAQESVRTANEAYERAAAEYDALLRDIETYEAYQKALG